MIRGTKVTLYQKTRIGIDPFHKPIYTEKAVTVPNILVYPATAEDIVHELSLSGKHLEYYLCVPKGDDHAWEDRRVTFLDETWQIFGLPEEWIPDNVPGKWNRRYKCERYKG